MVGVGIAIAALVVIVLAPLASPDPDGLERVAEDKGFLDRPRTSSPASSRTTRSPGSTTSAVDRSWPASSASSSSSRSWSASAASSRGAAPGLGAPPPGARPVRRGRQPVPPGRRPDQVPAYDRRDPRDLAAAGRLLPGAALVWLVARGLLRHRRPGSVPPDALGVIALPFTLVAFPLIFTIREPIIATLSLGPLDLTITDEGVRRFLTIMLGSWLSVQVALLLAFTTPFPDLIDALRELRLPRIMVAIITFMYRYLAVLGDEASRMLRARDARSAAVSGGGRLVPLARDRHRTHGRLAVPTLVRAQRAHLRGDAGTWLRGRVPPPPGTPDADAGLAWLPSCGSLIAAFGVIAFRWCRACDHRPARARARARHARAHVAPARPRAPPRRRHAGAGRPAAAPSSSSTSTSAIRTATRR